MFANILVRLQRYLNFATYTAVNCKKRDLG
nr:MAG TPA: hypothetical protein [Caudoviricetes sp.]